MKHDIKGILATLFFFLWLILLLGSCAPNIHAKQARLKDKADHKKEKPKNNYLPLIGIGLLSAWVVGIIDGDN